MSTDLTTILADLEQVVGRLGAALNARFLTWLEAPVEFESFLASLAAASTSVFVLCSQILLIVALVAGTFLVLGRQARQQNWTRTAWSGLLCVTAIATLALIIGLVVAQSLAKSDMPLRTLRLWALASVTGCLVLVVLRALFLGSDRPKFRLGTSHRAALAQDLSIAIGWAVFSLSIVPTLRLWNAGPGMTDLVGTGLAAIPTVLLVSGSVWQNRRSLAGAVAGPRPRSRWRGQFARSWPAILIAIVLSIFINAEVARTLGAALPGGVVLMTALIVIVTPHLDSKIWYWAQRGLDSPDISVAALAWRRTARFTVVLLMLTSLGTLWATPLAVGLGIDLRLVASDAFKLALIALLTAYLWNAITAIVNREALTDHDAANGRADSRRSKPGSRLGMLAPLLGDVGKSVLVTLSTLSMLVTVGVNVWPLVTGLSFLGLAISFGSQSLVKDVVSGIFFLIDDAFRLGEYIETPGAKGIINKISLRSVSLLDVRGAVATVPYGQMGNVQNFSRNWIIDELVFRVGLDTDVAKARSLLKKIGQDIAADPKLGPDLLEPFNSHCKPVIEDGALVIRANFTAKPGKQILIRRAALKAAHRAFRDNGIQAVPNR